MAARKERSISVLALVLFALILVSAAASNPVGGDPNADDEDLSFLDADDGDGASPVSDGAGEKFPPPDDDDYAGDFDAEPFDQHATLEDEAPAVDEKDVVVLTDKNFTGFVEGSRHVLVEFYAPWCGHCLALAPEFAAAATAMKEAGEDAALAKVDATEEHELAQKYEIQGFPTLLFFVDGVQRPYSGQRTKDGIITWIKKKIGPAVQNVTSLEEAEKVLTSENKLVLGFLNSLVGTESQELSAAAKLDDDINFYQTVNADVAKLFHIDPKAKRPSIVLLKKDEPEKLTYLDGDFSKSTIVEFVSANKLPLVVTFTRESASLIFDSAIKKQLLLFATSKNSENALPVFQEAAKSFKGKIIFVYVEIDNDDIGKPVSDYFGVTGDGPTVLAYSGNEDGNKYIFDGEITLGSIKTFAEGFLDDILKPFYKSDPTPAINDGDVKIVVGDNFDELVLDESKDVLLEIYAPWCGHCQALEPIYNKLAKHLRGIDTLVVAKMDGTTNEHPRAKADGFPTLLFFPAGNKSFDPITVESDRTVVAFYKFLKKHASIPFKIQKPPPVAKSDDSAAESPAKEVKDEL